MKRFFAFGCSFTEYMWLTWADIISISLSKQGYDCYNFGVSGMGNRGIATSVFRAHSKYKFTPDDLIMIVWSSWNREDRYIKTYKPGTVGYDDAPAWWTREGNVLSSGLYDNNFLMRYWSLDHDIISNIASISSVQQCFDIAFQGTLPFMERAQLLDELPQDELLTAYTMINADNIFALSNEFPDIPGHAEAFREDGHPTISQHMDYVLNTIQPQIEINICDIDTQAFCKLQNKKLLDKIYHTTKKTGSWRDKLIESFILQRENLLNKYNITNHYELWRPESGALDYLKENPDILKFNKIK